jgi:outer membrane protein assembly factor BamA
MKKNAYPFTSIQLKNIVFEQEQIAAEFELIKNNLIKIDSIHIKKTVKIPDTYIHKYLGISSGDLYNEDKIKNISQRLKELNFVREIKPFEIEFGENEADIYIYLEKRRANQFNGILGLLPNNRTTGKLMLTGELKLLLQNSFGKGETINIEWEKLESTTQKIHCKYIHPYIFRSPLGMDLNFNLIKKDSSYLTVQSNLGARFLMPGGEYIKVYFENKNSSLLSQNTETTNFVALNTTLYGIAYQLQRMDYIYNPRRGFGLYGQVGAGKKKQNKEGTSTQAEAEMDISFFAQITENIVLKFGNKSGYIYNEVALFDNELFNIGGMKNLRGFDEQSIIASEYYIFTIEARYLFEENSNFYLFWDGGYYQRETQADYVSDLPFGFGAGVNFETKAGIFTISYALGKQFDNPLELRSAKIHFGFVNRFGN